MVIFKKFLQHPLEHTVQFYPLNFKKDLVKLEKMERKAGNIIKGVEQLPMKRDQRSPQHFSVKRRK